MARTFYVPHNPANRTHELQYEIIRPVEAATTYARFLSSVGITPENYPVFLRMLEIENHWVIDALIGERDPFLLLSGVQPNKYIVGRILAMMTRWHKGGIYHKNLSESGQDFYGRRVIHAHCSRDTPNCCSWG